jgi:hypothetical protein
MNLICPECKATIFTPSNDKEFHQRIMDGHMNAVHSDVKVRMTKLLNRSIAVLLLIQQQGGVGRDGKIFTKFQARDLQNDIQDVLKIPRTTFDVPAPSVPSATVANAVKPAAPVPGTTKLMKMKEDSGKQDKPAVSAGQVTRRRLPQRKNAGVVAADNSAETGGEPAIAPSTTSPESKPE